MIDNQPFMKMIAELRYGSLLDDLTEKMQELVNACNSTGRKGSLTLTINLSPGKGGEVAITDKIVSKVPELEKGSSIMFITPEGNLQRSDPRQMTIDSLKTIGNKQPTELKEVK